MENETLVLSVAICDDDQVMRAEIRELILNKKPETKVRIFSSVDEMFMTDDDFSIYFLDIKGVGGLDAAREIRARQSEEGACRSIIIFITGYREYMEEAFDVHAFHYLVKPFDESKFYEIFESACREASRIQNEKFLLVKSDGLHKKISISKIIYVESCGKKVRVRTGDNDYEIYGKLDDLASSLGESFYRCHRGFIVNLEKIAAYSAGTIRLVNGENIIMSRRKYPDFVKVYMRYAKNGGVVNV